MQRWPFETGASGRVSMRVGCKLQVAGCKLRVEGSRVSVSANGVVCVFFIASVMVESIEWIDGLCSLAVDPSRGEKLFFPYIGKGVGENAFGDKLL